MRILVTAGPTREHLDAVRFLSNGATGRLGIEIARAAAAAGHAPVLVLGPTHLEAPREPGIDVIRVTSALDMLDACLCEWPSCDALVATAAVSDHRPARRAEGKPPKAEAGGTLELVANPDILATLAAGKGARRVVGFALQTDDGEARAREKLVTKGLDAVVLDDPAALGADRANFTILLPDGQARRLADCAKTDLARAIVEILSER